MLNRKILLPEWPFKSLIGAIIPLEDLLYRTIGNSASLSLDRKSWEPFLLMVLLVFVEKLSNIRQASRISSKTRPSWY